MDAVRPEQMNDGAFDREIAAALNVEPSPAFAARVRQRIADEPITPTLSLSWSIGAATALAVAIVAAVFFRIAPGAQPTVSMPRAAFIEGRTLAGISELQADRSSDRFSPKRNRSVHGASIVPPSSVVSGFSRTSSPVSGFGRTEPEILIDVREANALRALFAGASLGTVDLIPLASAAGNAAHELTPPAEIVIAPLVNEPLTPMPGGGARR
jgi:hypothetical protein